MNLRYDTCTTIFFPEKYLVLVKIVHKIVALADELIEQNCFLTKCVQDLNCYNRLTNEISTRDMMSVLFQNFRGRRLAISEQEKMEFLMEAINNLSKLADLFVARNCYLIKCIYAHFGEEYFDHSQ